MVLPPIVYPDHVPTRYPAQTDQDIAQAASNNTQQETSNTQQSREQEPAGAAADQSEADDLHFLDSVENRDDPNMPLTPLPAPLAPVVMPSAKKAAVMQTFGLDGEWKITVKVLNFWALKYFAVVILNSDKEAFP